ncbi:hypothetical protein L1987_45836 [Smallanthus sonchifolius]|uniref:Uncharacterized protein n=1 Tax=Smallanthus sonchifolius TaxID=185202 RepID=A0ACB9FZ39_9ASTR|nr:hypothetical protein L1987_45836 [Smallanthus sonchifolius]
MRGATVPICGATVLRHQARSFQSKARDRARTRRDRAYKVMARAFTSEFNLLALTQPEWKGAALQYRKIIDFLNRSKLNYAISADLVVSRPYLEQFWKSADHDCTVTPNVIRATIAGHDIAISEDTVRRVLQFRDLSNDPMSYLDYFVDGCWRQRMGKAGKDAMGYDLAAAMVALSLNKGYNFSKYIYKSITDQINAADRFRFLLYSSDEQQEEEEVGSKDDMSEDEGDEEQVVGGAEESDSESTESDSSDSDDAPSQAHPRRLTKVTLPESSSKRKLQSTSSEYEPDSDSDALYKHVEVSAQRQVHVSAASTDSASTSPSQQLYRRQRRRPQVTPDVAVTAITEEVSVIVTFPVPFVQVAVTTPILTENHESNDARIDTLETQVDGLLETVRKSREESEAQQAQINLLVDEVTILRSQRTGTKERLTNVMAQNELLIKTNNMILGYRTSLEVRFDMQRKEHEMMVKLVAEQTKKLAAQGEREKEKEKASKSTGDEACHPVDLTMDDDKEKDPEVSSSGSEQQALAIVPISAVPMAGGSRLTRKIEALCNIEEGEIDFGDYWDKEDDDVVIEVPKGDGEGEYEFEDGEIFEVPSFESHLDTGSVEPASTVEASTEASSADLTPVDLEVIKDKHMPASSSKDCMAKDLNHRQTRSDRDDLSYEFRQG